MPLTGQGAANWFVYGGCGNEKIYHVNAGQPIFLEYRTDSYGYGSCHATGFFIDEWEAGSWGQTAQYILPAAIRSSHLKSYTPSSNQIRVRSDRCFYLKVYTRYPVS